MITRRKVDTPVGVMTDTTVVCDGCGEKLELGFVEWNWSWTRVYTGEYPDWTEWALCPRCKREATWCADCGTFHLPGEAHRTGS